MLRHKTETRPGLVALYNIRPGNRVGLFLQPSDHTGREYRQLKQNNHETEHI